MPRPSDLYAHLGAPGMYQATAWTPAVLPNVFLIPPAEDNQQAYCIFYSGSASPSTYDPFYSAQSSVQRDPATTDTRVLNQALALLHGQHQAAAAGPGFSRRHAWEHVEPPSRGPAYTSDAVPNVRFVVEHEGAQALPSRPASRRSSVFGERPAEHEFSEDSMEEEEGVAPGGRKPQTMTLKNRAALAFKAFGSTRTRKAEGDEQPEAEDEVVHRQASFRLEQGSVRSQAQQEPKRRTLAQVFAAGPSSSASVNVSPLSELQPPTAPSSKRKSITQLLGFTRSATLAKLEVYDTPSSWDAASPTSKLSKRKSMTQLLGLTRRALSAPALASVDPDPVHTTAADAHLAALRALEGPVSPKSTPSTKSTKSQRRRSSITASDQVPDIQTSPAGSSLSTETVTRRKSFLQGRTLSFLDLHRRFSPQPASAAQESTAFPTVPSSPPSDTTESSQSNPACTDSEPEVEDTVRVFAQDGDGVMDFASTIQLDSRGKEPWFDSLAPGDVDVDDDEPALELASRLNSLSFDQLAFDPVSFQA